MSAPDLTDAAVLLEDVAFFRRMAKAPFYADYAHTFTRAALALEDVAARLERPAPDLTAHDTFVAHATLVAVSWFYPKRDREMFRDACLSPLIAAAEARGYARAKMEAQP